MTHFCLSQRSRKLQLLISLNLNKRFLIVVLRKVKLGSFIGYPLNNPPNVPAR